MNQKYIEELKKNIQKFFSKWVARHDGVVPFAACHPYESNANIGTGHRPLLYYLFLRRNGAAPNSAINKYPYPIALQPMASSTVTLATFEVTGTAPGALTTQ